MKLTRYTDFALRTMIHLAARPEELSSIRAIAGAYGISQNHLMKVVNDLGHAGFVEAVRGRNGGIRLGRPADQITLGEIVRHTEGHEKLVDCDGCLISPVCTLPRLLSEATEAFMRSLDRYRLSDLVASPEQFRALLAIAE
ncbi:Rrf2 family transcriptional regulator [Paracoccus caeni]|uniref:Rrf2 family transcriptional regulator n=1 Tax=Paracoccus caeni TaxID=657651 RepID=A0A934SHD8_9RHOB|nr:Rrf2 family transcriptional regulator [Paracoccus caeni]MBK4217673.1 Rrf2 family transcriptional regulator [Paracoccus caeni]